MNGASQQCGGAAEGARPAGTDTSDSGRNRWSTTSPPTDPGPAGTAGTASTASTAGTLDPAHTARLLAAAVPVNTVRTRSVGRRTWLAWATRTGTSPLTPTAGQLANFAAFLLTVGSPLQPVPRPLTVGTVEAYLSAASSWTVAQGRPRPDLTAARQVLRGQQRTVGIQRIAKAAPVTLQVLQQLVDAAMLSVAADGAPTLRALRNRALVLLGFAIAARRSELVAIDVSHLQRVPQGLNVEVWSAKTRLHSDLIAVPFARHATALCPVQATFDLQAALAARGLPSGPLFRPISRTDAVLPRRLGGKSVTDIVSALAATAGVPVPDGAASWSSHSLRRGAATELRRAGADPLTIARQGRWKDGSKVLASYCEDLDKWTDHPLQRML